jgi:DNA-cytosine methyltransferase
MVLKVADFFCGAGGFSEGFRQMGFEIVYGTDIWPHAVETFRKNFPDAEVPDPIDILDINIDDIPDVDVIIGGPPCTFFSSSNNGGNGDVKMGMRLVKGYLRIIEKKNPKWWIMENVPRLLLTLPEIVSLHDPALGGENKTIQIPIKHIFNAADYGVPQGRKRLFSGNYPLPIQTHSEKGENNTEKWKWMKKIIEGFPYPLYDGNISKVNDPLYPQITLDSSDFTEHRYDTFLTEMEVEVSRRLKTRHRYYGKMNFPDYMERPARTVMASTSRTCREMMVIEEKRGKTKGYRIPTLRECASLQSFPITYQFWAKNISPRYRLVGNAVPPILSRAIARAILIAEGLTPHDELIIRKKVTEMPEVLSVDAASRRRLRIEYPIDRYYCDFIDYHASQSRTGCRIDIDNRGEQYENHPAYSGNGMVLRHIVEWRCVLYTGYAKNVQKKVVSLDDALSLLNRNNPKEFNEKMICIIDEIINNRLNEIPDATTCQGILSGRVKGVRGSPFWIKKMLLKIVDDNFPEKKNNTSKIEDSGRINIRPNIEFTQRNAAQLILAALVCTVINESDLWLLENWDQHFRMEEWPMVKKPYHSNNLNWKKKIKQKIMISTSSGDPD